MSQLRRRSLSPAEVVAVLFLLSAFPAAGQVRVSTIQETIERWKPEAHIYVMGDVGLQDAALADLEAWLKDRQWTVLLVQDAAGQQFQEVGGGIRGEQEAIEYGTGQGIARAPGFAPDGAILSIVLAQRALYYTAGPERDSRGLGEAAFRDNLDQWAIAALRNGGDLVSAVKDTVTNVDTRLEWAIFQEQAQAAEMLAQARRQIEAAEAAITLVEEKAAALRSAPPHPQEGLALPGTAPLREETERARSLLEKSPVDARQVADQVIWNAEALKGRIDLYPAGAVTLDGLRNRLQRLERHEFAEGGRNEIRHASQVLAGAHELYRRADPDYVRQLDQSEAALSHAEAAVRRAEEQEAFRSSLFSFLGLILLSVLVRIAWRLNRRRRPVKKEAESLLASWQTALDRKLEVLFGELEQRVGWLVGPVSGDGRRFSGETAELARQVRSDVGSLAILWTSAHAVLEQARERIRPRRPWPVLRNLFFAGNYRRGLALLRDEPVPFDPVEGLPRLFEGERTWRDDLLGNLTDYEPFRKSFEELMEEFHSRAARAAGALDELEAALNELPPLLKKAHERIWQAEFQKDFLQGAGAGDGLFLVPALFSEVLTAGTAALTDAQGTAASDPVATRKGSAALAERLAAEGWRLAGLCRSVRSGVMPALQAAEGRLQEAGFPIAWIGEWLRFLSGRAAELAVRTTREPVLPEIERLAVDLAVLQTRAEHAVELAGRLAETRARVSSEEARVDLSRREMGTALGLDAEILLREKGADPSERLADAAAEAGEAETRLGRGEVDEAAAALERANWLASETAAIVEASLQTFAARETGVEEQRAETERIAALVPEHELVLAGTREAFAESALSLGPGDEVHPGADGTVGDNAEEAREEVASARGKLDGAAAEIRAGRMLAAASLLRQVRGHQEQAGFRLAEIAAKRARLDRAREENRGLLGVMEVRVADAGPELSGDARIRPQTLAAFEEVAANVWTAREGVDTGKEDPLRIGEDLVAARAGLDRIDGTLAPADRKLYREAAALLDRARAVVEEAGSWSSAYGVSIPGVPGVNLLALAEEQVREGRYEEAKHSADQAWEIANVALEGARAEESRESYRSSSSSDDDSSSSSSFTPTISSSSSPSSDSGSGSSGWSGSDSGSGSSSWDGSDSGSGKSGW